MRSVNLLAERRTSRKAKSLIAMKGHAKCVIATRNHTVLFHTKRGQASTNLAIVVMVVEVAQCTLATIAIVVVTAETVVVHLAETAVVVVHLAETAVVVVHLVETAVVVVHLVETAVVAVHLVETVVVAVHLAETAVVAVHLAEAAVHLATNQIVANLVVRVIVTKTISLRW